MVEAVGGQLACGNSPVFAWNIKVTRTPAPVLRTPSLVGICCLLTGGLAARAVARRFQNGRRFMLVPERVSFSGAKGSFRPGMPALGLPGRVFGPGSGVGIPRGIRRMRLCFNVK